MEIPDNVKNLYCHWNKHTQIKLKKNNLNIPNQLKYFINERMEIWQKKTSGEKPPYTNDPILQKYRFCNIYRELDKQTIQIHTNLKNIKSDFDLWLLNIAFYRFICNTKTVEDVGLLNYNAKNNQNVFVKLKNHQRPKYGSAYVFPISIIQKSNYPNREKFLCFYLPKIIPKIAKQINAFDNTTVNQALNVILPEFKFNFKFHWTEILIDIAYQFPTKINLYKDFHVGPGAIQTAKIIDKHKNSIEVVDLCVGIKLEDFKHLTYNNKPVLLSAENWEGIFCEYRKYFNLKNGTGRVRRFSS